MARAALRLTAHRQAVLRVLWAHPTRFLDAETMYLASLDGEGVPINLSSAYRILVELERAGVVQSVKLNARVLYRLLAQHEAPQPHLLCEQCGHCQPLASSPLMPALLQGAQQHGFRLGACATLIGWCTSCLKIKDNENNSH